MSPVVQRPGPTPTPGPTPAYILAGGMSSRFGSDKALAPVRGVPLLVRVVESLDGVARPITVVADRAGKYDHLGLRTLADRRPGRGPLAGLETALSDCREPGFVLFASCDRLGIQRSWLESLLSAAHDQVSAVALRSDLWQPLPALIRADPETLSRVSAAIDRGALGLSRLLDELGATAVDLPADWTTSSDVNDPGCLAGWLARTAHPDGC